MSARSVAIGNRQITIKRKRRKSVQHALTFFPAFIASSFNRFCYERDNGYKTHRAKRSCLFQAHYKNDDNLEGIRKRKQEAIWQSTFSFLSPYSTAMDVSSFPSLVQAELWFESYNVTSSLLHKDFNSRLAERGKTFI